jgi:hypothetical protein
MIKIKKTPEEVIIKISGKINENDFLELVSLIRCKLSGANNNSENIKSKECWHKEPNWWKENQLLL